jgi:hypothetical protein
MAGQWACTRTASPIDCHELELELELELHHWRSRITDHSEGSSTVGDLALADRSWTGLHRTRIITFVLVECTCTMHEGKTFFELGLSRAYLGPCSALPSLQPTWHGMAWPTPAKCRSDFRFRFEIALPLSGSCVRPD